MNTKINFKIIKTIPNTEINRNYLGVPYSRISEAKSLGAKFEPQCKLWYTFERNENFDKLIQLFPPFKEIKLIGEDRSFGGNQLYVDLVPKSCWFNNVRYCIAEVDWENLKKTIYRRTNSICECCGVPSTSSLEAHERWSYDDENKIQKLERLIALCKDCHTATHMGLAQIRGIEDQAKKHLQKVTGYNDNELSEHIDNAFSIYRKRSETVYKLDLSLIINSDIKPMQRKINFNDKELNTYIDNALDISRERSKT